jgi:hypothetical protein
MRVSPGILRSRLVKFGTALAVVAATIAGGVQPAAADADVPYLRTDPSSGLSGYGIALNGSVNFYNNHHASYYFEVFDRCAGDGSGDGYAAMLRARAIRGDGTVTAWTAWEGDDAGCADNAGRIAMEGWDLPQRRIVRVEVQLCLRKPSTGTLAACVQPSWRNQHI